MKKLNKEQLKAKNDYSEKIIDNFTKLEKAITEFNAEVAEAFTEVDHYFCPECASEIGQRWIAAAKACSGIVHDD